MTPPPSPEAMTEPTGTDGATTESTTPTAESPPPPPASTARPIHQSDEYRCHACGYSLRGLAAMGACPECRTIYDPLPPRIPAGYVCYRCSYSLTDMPTDGACPECGTQYSFAHAFRGLPYPGQVSLVLRLAWPSLLALPLVGFSILQGLASRSSAEGAVCVIVLLYVLNLLNFPISTSNVLRNYVPPSKRRGYIAAIRSLGQWVIASWFLSLVFLAVPIAVLGVLIISSIFR